MGKYGADIEVAQYLQNNEETQGYEELRNQTDVAVFKVSPKTKYCAIGKVNCRDSLNNSKAECMGVANRSTVLRECRLMSNRKVKESKCSKKRRLV